jgi:hypothetical protein
MSYRFVDNFRAAAAAAGSGWNCSASSWFYYKEICYDARSRERKKRKKFDTDFRSHSVMGTLLDNVFGNSRKSSCSTSQRIERRTPKLVSTSLVFILPAVQKSWQLRLLLATLDRVYWMLPLPFPSNKHMPRCICVQSALHSDLFKHSTTKNITRNWNLTILYAL